MKKPVIGVLPLVDADRDSYWMLPGYMEGVRQEGGLPLMLPLTDDPGEIRQLADLCDGFLFTGGQDVSPSVYGEETLPCCGETSAARDAMEIALLSAALEQGRPLLGICRGIQLINAALGGTLYQDLDSQLPGAAAHHQSPPYDAPAHTVTVLRDTPLHDLLRCDRLAVNSYHHQGVKTTAPGLSVMASAPDGLTEGVWLPDYPFCWAVQWHPEFSYETDPNSRAVFRAFVDACRPR